MANKRPLAKFNGDTDHIPSKQPMVEVASSSFPKEKDKLRVLSLFDGIGTGYLALSESGFDIDVYYASEIDKDAVRVTSYHFGNNVKQLGSVTDINKDVLKSLGKINLLIGGSPCTDLSLVNREGKGLYDTLGTGPMFFEFYRIWNILKQTNEPFYWFFENVCHMKVANRDTISKFLGRTPYIIDSLSITPQCRKRFFWSNIPGLAELETRLHEMKLDGPVLDQYLNKNLGRTANVRKVNTITTKRSCLQDGKSKNPVDDNGVDGYLHITEIEKIFGFPLHYTDVADINIPRRHVLIGRAWSVAVVQLICGCLKNTFKLKEQENSLE